MVEYIKKYSGFRYGIDVAPFYIDPATDDYNDIIYADVNDKRRCSDRYDIYYIVSNKGFAMKGSGLAQYPSLVSCIYDMTENYTSMSIYNPCYISTQSPDCLMLKTLVSKTA